MTIEYPEIMKCPHCQEKIRINYGNGTYAETNDILTLAVNIPHSFKSGVDARKNKQNIFPIVHNISICSHCKTILAINFGAS